MFTHTKFLFLLKHSFLLRQESLAPPKQYLQKNKKEHLKNKNNKIQIIKKENNLLTRWSEKLCVGWPQQPSLSTLSIGLEGCTSAFNALNSIRTCLYFNTNSPPCFLALNNVSEIQHLNPRYNNNNNNNKEENNEEESKKYLVTLGKVAEFGENNFLNHSKYKNFPIVALENYTNRSKSIHACRFPPTARLIVGHENKGVSSKYIDNISNINEKKGEENLYCAAKEVIYIPQYGTISSLNVVTSMGIAIFYALLDMHYPSSRKLITDLYSSDIEIINNNNNNKEWETLSEYQSFFKQQLPMISNDFGSSRIDKRPVHPLYYNKKVSSIIDIHHHLRQILLQTFRYKNSSLEYPRFGLSVLYENVIDQRSLSGIVRSSNAFLVDNVYYFGKKKINVVGTIGTQHYTPPIYLGPSNDEKENNNNNNSEIWALNLKQQLEKENGAPITLWFFDCGHDFLYTQNTENSNNNTKENDENKSNNNIKSCLDSLLWYNTHRNDVNFTLSLTDQEEHLRAVAEKEEGCIVLLIPQEGILPPFSLLQLCKRLLTVLPNNNNNSNNTEKNTAGLPVSVAAGIALQRLSTIMHPQVMTL